MWLVKMAEIIVLKCRGKFSFNNQYLQIEITMKKVSIPLAEKQSIRLIASITPPQEQTEYVRC